MLLTIYGEEINFHKMELTVLQQGIDNLFAGFDRKTFYELVQQKKYEHLKKVVEHNYSRLLDLPAGQALLQLKNEGNLFYRQFLNNYGDLTYSRFIVEGEPELLKQNGIYLIIVDDILMFCGVCARSFRERFNQHIGSIYAKGCFRDGTATHCHINANITQMLTTHRIYFAVSPMTDKKEMNRLKNTIIKRFEPEWNLRSSNAFYEVTSV